MKLDAAVSSSSCAVGRFESRPFEVLADVLKAKDEVTLRQRLQKEFGIEDPWVQYIFMKTVFFFQKKSLRFLFVKESEDVLLWDFGIMMILPQER